MNNYAKIGAVALTLLVAFTLPSFAITQDFESYTGTDLFATTTPSPNNFTDVNGATFTGGAILTDTANLPADETSVYGTADTGTGLSSSLVISSATGFNNFFFDLLNGVTTPQSFLITDNAGHSAEFDNVAANTDSGAVLVGFASTGTQITIEDLTANSVGGFWDFFIDNVTWDEPLPPSLSAPEVSSTGWLLAGGLISLAAFASRRRATA